MLQPLTPALTKRLQYSKAHALSPALSRQGGRCLHLNINLSLKPRQGGGAELPESFAVLGFAFYLQPCLLPLLAEMPPGAAGVRLMTAATRTVIMGVATVVGALEGRKEFLGA